MAKNSVTLKALHKSRNENFSDELNIRLHRAIKWLGRSEQEEDDFDAQFIFVWISFNAAYAELFGVENSERSNLQAFFNKLVLADKEDRIYRLLFDQFTGVIRTLIENKFVFEPYWKAMREQDSSEHWQESFSGSKTAAMKRLMEHDTVQVLQIVFDRLYVLRNQLIHGGATWNSMVNRQQVKDGVNLMNKFVPIVIELIIENSDEDWGELIYPVVKQLKE